ncbi:ATP-binding cassette domain-containing protein [Halobacillus litoralis]|uniref:ABC transporter domain-containing protein n=1 Tax=Halobacillus litoralis TaxID=45668 RepID=A0A410MJE3_9BACI|nr:ATP-binding cassette domain-containing protein [Halobacillus litoralis]QAS54810.1 hypothetical protein HLI_21390 [Halobacillus litoralis]
MEIVDIEKKVGKKSILKNVSCEFKGVYGLLGPNGAGKTTLMKILASVNSNYNGHVKKNGIKNVGYLPQDFFPYKNLSIEKILNHLGTLKGLNKETINNEIDAVLKELNLLKYKQYKVKELSGGMVRRLGIAQAILGRPELLIIDEPFNGLDLEEKIRLKFLLKKISLDENRVTIITSHLVDEMEEICTNIGLLFSGEMVKSDGVNELLSDLENKIWELECDKGNCFDVNRGLILSETFVSANRKKLRIYSDENVSGGKVMSPTLKDIYLYYNQKANNNDYTQ